MHKRLSNLSLLVVMASLITFSCLVAAGEGQAPRSNWSHSGSVSEVAWGTRHNPAPFYGVGVAPAVYFVNFRLAGSGLSF